MKALITPLELFTYTWISNWFKNDQNKWEPIYSNIEECVRIAEVQFDNNAFDIALPLYWIDCPDNCTADDWYFKDGIVLEKPINTPRPIEE